MRLTCPNCGAQYEVPTEVIPTNGRDVQCSNCGNTWFEAHPDHPVEMAEEAGETVPEPQQQPMSDQGVEVAEEPSAPVEEPSAPVEEPDVAAFSDDEFSDDDSEDVDVVAEPEPQAQVRSGLDSAVSKILRQEAEREAALRAAESGSGLESQPDLGLDEIGSGVPPRSEETSARMARMRGQDPGGASKPEAASALNSRRDMLPDIEEINSTLRSGDEDDTLPDAAAMAAGGPRRSGFARGFLLSLVVVAALAYLYAKAPSIAQSLPQADPVLSAYVGLVDQARGWLDGLVNGMTSKNG